MKRAASERGVALLAVLTIILALLPLAAAVAMQTQLDGLMQRNLRGGIEAFYAAEAGLAHALSEIGPRADLAELLDGPDRRRATADDGQFPFVSSPPAAFAQPAIGYEVWVANGPAEALRVYSRGRGHHDAVREVEALIRPANAPFTPAALYAEGDDVAIELGEALLVSGIPEGSSGTATAVAGLAVSSAAAAAQLRSLLAASPQVVGAGRSPSITDTTRLDLEAYTDVLRSRLDAVVVTAPSGTPLGTEAKPQLTIIDGAWRIDAAVDGFGILVVRGDVEIGGRLHYRGLVISGGKVTSTPASDLRIDGALWMRGDGGAQLTLHGTGYVRYDSAALARVDSMIAGALLHRAVVTGWREVT